MFDGLVLSQNIAISVIPVETGIQCFQAVTYILDTRFRGYDNFLRGHHV